MPTKRRRSYAGPLVAQETVTEYLKRPLENYDWIKKAKRLHLTKALNGFQFSASGQHPWMNQLQCFTLGMDLPQFLFFSDMGSGKTALILALFRWHREHSGVKRMLIGMPKEVHFQSWLDEIEIHAPELSYTILLGSTAERRALLEQKKKTDLYLINYPGLQLLMSSLQPGPKKKKKRYIDAKQAKSFAQMFDMVTLDESHKIGNVNSLTYTECRYFTRYCRFRYALTGTPFGRDPIMLWPQFHIIDNGETLGNTLGLFRAVFYNAKDRYWGGIEYTFDQRMEQELHRMIKNRSIYYQDTEFSDIPPMPPAVRLRVNFSVSAKQQYRNVIRRVKESHGSIEERKNAFVRMRMCTSGFLSVKSDIEDRLTIYFEENPKLDMLEEKLGDVPEDSKCLIYHDFVISGGMIEKMLRRLKIPYATLSGRTKDPMGELRRFKHDDSVRIFVCNNESGSTTINPQEVANYIFFFESSVSPITRRQAMKRIHRPGQKKHCYFYDLVVAKSIDERILQFHEEGKDMFEAIVQGNKDWLEDPE